MSLPDGLVKDGFQVPLREGRALEVLVCPDVLGGSQCLVVGDGLHALLAEAVDGRRVLPQIELRADQDDGDIGRVMADLWVPL